MHPLKFFSNKICFQQQGITTCREKSFFCVNQNLFLYISNQLLQINAHTTLRPAMKKDSKWKCVKVATSIMIIKLCHYIWYKLRNKFDRLHFIKIFNTFCTQLRKATWYFHTKENFHQNSICNYIIKINSVGDYGRKKLIVLYKLCRQVE